MQIKNFLLSVLLVFFVFKTNSQNSSSKSNKQPISTSKLNYRYIPSIKQQIAEGTFIEITEDVSNRPSRDKRMASNKVVPGKGLPKGVDPLLSNNNKSISKKIRPTSLTFQTTDNTSTPSDPTGAVGRDYYIASWNTAFRIFNKDGTPATAAASLSTLFPGGADGDPIVLYDSQADRYIVTEFEDNPNGFHVAISETNDPINDGWHTYSANSFQTGTFPDYTKFSIWSDAYYVTANISASDGSGNTRNGQVWALERDKMLAGDNTASIQAFTLTGMVTSGFYSPQAFNVTDDNLPAPGNATLVYMQDDAWAGVSSDHLKLWTINVDWNDPNNSSISNPTELPVSDFTGVFDGGSFANLSQPAGPDIDAMQATIMNQAQFRKFDGYNSAVFNFVVNTDPQNELAGIRWYELRQSGDGQPWSIYQEGTYVAPEGRHAFGASMAMDGQGNIGMAYSSVSSEESISLRYSGRFKDDPLNTMTALEELIVLSDGNSPSTRYADYSHLTVDPSTDADFWFVSEYFSNGRRSNMVGVFQLTEPYDNDLGISDIEAPTNGVLSDEETITVEISNYGTNTASNFELGYSIDNGQNIVETYTGEIDQGESVSYSFNTTADLSEENRTYTISAFTSLGTDENNSNNEKIATVTNSLEYCKPTATVGCNVDGIKKFILGDIDADDGANGCNSTGDVSGYVDRRELSTELDRSASEHVLRAQHNWSTFPSGEALSMWIDFNNDGSFDNSEHIIQGVNFSVANSLEDFPFSLSENATLGSHVLRVKAIDITSNGDINDACSDFSYGEVHDYTITIIDSTLDIDNFNVENGKLEVLTLGNNQFKFNLHTTYNDILSFRVYDVLGRTIVFNNIKKEGDKYTYDLDLSYASKGTYFVKIGGKKNYKEYKIIVN